MSHIISLNNGIETKSYDLDEMLSITNLTDYIKTVVPNYGNSYGGAKIRLLNNNQYDYLVINYGIKSVTRSTTNGSIDGVLVKFTYPYYGDTYRMVPSIFTQMYDGATTNAWTDYRNDNIANANNSATYADSFYLYSYDGNQHDIAWIAIGLSEI